LAQAKPSSARRIGLQFALHRLPEVWRDDGALLAFEVVALVDHPASKVKPSGRKTDIRCKIYAKAEFDADPMIYAVARSLILS
jgi:hypothetical protein